MWPIINKTMTKPPLIALIVGSSIHLLLFINASILMGQNYFRFLASEMSKDPIYGFVKFIVPFLVPYIITLINRKIVWETEIKSLMKFPEANPDMVLRLNEEGQITFRNNAAKHLLADMLPDTQDIQVLLPQDTKEIVAQISGTDQAIRLEHKINDTLLELNFRSFPDESAVFVSGRNITERRQSEIDRLAAFPGENPLPVIELDPAGKITYINPAGQARLEDEDGNEAVLDKLFTTDYYHQILASIEEKMDIPQIIVNVDDRTIMWTCKLIPSINRVHIYGTDVTDLKRTEEKIMKARDEAIRASRVKTIFLENMSHEIRTRLNGMLGFVSVLQEKYQRELNDQEKEIFNFIESSGKRLMRTVHNILDMSQIETGTYSFEPTTFDLVEITGNIYNELNAAA